MLLGYFQQPAAVFHDGRGNGIRSSDGQATVQVKHTTGKQQRRSSLTRPSTFLTPLSILLRGTADVVNSAVLQIRDGLTEEQRAAAANVEERKQILLLRLEEVSELLLVLYCPEST